jgi:hypothetical protein
MSERLLVYRNEQAFTRPLILEMYIATNFRHNMHAQEHVREISTSEAIAQTAASVAMIGIITWRDGTRRVLPSFLVVLWKNSNIPNIIRKELILRIAIRSATR